MTELKPYPEYKDSGVEWLGTVPRHWLLEPLGRRFVERKRTVSDAEYLPLSVTRSGIVPQLDDVAKTENGDARKLVKAGDFAINSRSDRKGSSGIADRDGSVSVITTVLTPRLMDPRFIHHLLRSVPFQEEYYRFGTGIVADLWSTRWPAMKRIRLAVPPAAEQSTIGSFLDRETAEIDAFIADQEDLIGLLAERRDAAWQSAIDRLGATEVPLRRAIASIVDGPFGSSLTSAHYSDNGARVIRLGNIGIDEFKDTDRAYIPIAYFTELRTHSVSPGDVVVAGLGDDRMPLGRAAVVPDLGLALVKADCYRVRPNRLATSEYIAWILSAPQTRARFGEISRGSTRQRLNTAVVRDVLVPLPSVADQMLVVAETRGSLHAIDASIADAREAIALSWERRAALISAAVTGEIDVRGVV